MSVTIVNPNFDEPLPNGSLNGWNPSNTDVSNEFFQSSPASAELGNTAASIDQTITTVAQAIYELTFFVRTAVANSTIVVRIDQQDTLIPIQAVGSFEPHTLFFVAQTNSTNILFINSNPPGRSIWLDTVSVVFINIICYSGNSLVLCRNKITGKISNTRAAEIFSSTHEVYSTNSQKFVPVKYNITTGPTERYILIKKDSIGKNQPIEDFYVTSGHIIVINGIKIKARDIPNAKRVKVSPEKVYSICVEKQQPILVNGLDVMAWGEKNWLDYAAKKDLAWKDNKLNL